MNRLRAASADTERAPGILVVDDDVQVLKFVTRMLGSLGYRSVFQAATVEEAHEIWAAHQSSIDLVITDFVMPVKTGDAMALQMQKEKLGVRILLISGNDPSNLNSAIPLRPGINFLQKPFTVGEMRKSIESLALSS